MSDSGSIKFPPPSVLLPDRGTVTGSEPPGSAVRLLNVPENVSEEVGRTNRPLKLEGEVVHENRDGSIRVRTERGDIDIRLPESRRPPERGQRIEIEIRPPPSPDRPPETANIRPAQQAAPPPAPDRQTSTPVRIDIESAPLPAQSPETQAGRLPPESRPATQATASQPAPPPRLEELSGLVVRFLPLPGQDGQQAAPAQQPPPSATAAAISLASATEILLPHTATQNGLPATGQPPSGTQAPAQPGTIQTPASSQQPLPAPGIAPDKGAFPPQFPASPGQNFLLENTMGQQSSAVPGHMQTAAPLFDTSPFFSALPSLSGSANGISLRINAAFLPDQPGMIPPPGALPSPESTPEKGKSMAASILQAAPPAEGILSAVVTGKTPSGQPVVTIFPPGMTPDLLAQTGQVFLMQIPGENISLGAQLHLTPPASGGTASPGFAAGAHPFPLPLTPGPWPLMDDLLQNIMQISPQATQSLVNIVPSPASPAQMSPAMLFFIAAVRGNDLTQWLGERSAETLRREGRVPLLSRLAQESGALSRLAAEPLPQEWRAVSLPMYHQGEIHKIALYHRHERPPEDGSTGNGGQKGTRFVFDLSLHAMGRVQIDGLFRPVSSAGKRLDLILRTEQAFSALAQNDMRKIYAQALRETQITGELSFQNRPDQWFSIGAAPERSSDISA